MRIGIFDLTDPPAGMVETVTKTVAAIDFPWERVQPYLDREGIDAIRICWGAPDWMSNTTTGNWHAADNTIYLSTQFTDWADSVRFVLTHEIGHLVDTATLTTRQRAYLMAVMHDHPDWGVPPIVTHDSADMHHLEFWFNGGAPYPARIYECFADLFVASFAPTTWEGRFPRFVHWSTDFDAVRRIVLADPKPTPTPEPKPPRRRRRPGRRRPRRLCQWLHRRH